MKGTKRLAVFEPSSESNDFAFSSKRTVGGSFFDGSKADEPSQPPSMFTPQLDVQRAASSQQHVRALNIQFASWVNTQLKDHPDEVWEDGVRDYISHASAILEKFSDVVRWLKANTERGGIGSMEGSYILPKGTTGLKSAEIKPNITNTQNSQDTTTPNFATPFVMPTFTSKELKPNSDNTGFSQSYSAISFSTPNLMPDFGGKETKSDTSGTVFTGNTTKSFGASKVMPAFGSKDTNSNTSGTGIFTGNFVPSFGNSKEIDFGSKDTNSNTGGSGFLTRNSAPSFGISKAIPDFGSKDTNLNASGTGFSTSNTNFNFGTPKVMPDFASRTETTSTLGNIGVSQVNSTQSSTPSWGSGAPFLFGNKSLAPVNTTVNDAEEETEPEQPGSPSLKRTEEEGISVVYEVKCKLYVKSTDPADKDSWKDKGMGNLSIKCREGASRGTKESKPTVIVRNDVGKLLLNALIYPGIKINLQKNSIVAIFHTLVDEGGNDGASNGTAVARTFLIRTKTEEDRDKLAAIIQECAPPV
ncbi:hypothetical protein QQ045_016720 [Rhodiola kirilowii]